VSEPDLATKLAADLEKSGFGAEMRVLQTFHARGWRCNGGNSFFDLDEKVSREFDVHAWLVSTHPARAGRLRVFSHLAVEVKKSERPWVIFQHASLPKWQLGGGWTDVLSRVFDFPKEPTYLLDAFVGHSLTRKLGWKGYGIHEAFKNPDQPSRWYSACITAVKAAEHILETSADPEGSRGRPSPDPNQQPPELNTVQPILVLDGPLFRASLTEAGIPQVEPISAAEIDFVFKTPEYRNSCYRIAVITLAGLGEQLERLEARHRSLFDSLMTQCGWQPSNIRAPHALRT
jgi:hypothetical protein